MNPMRTQTGYHYETLNPLPQNQQFMFSSQPIFATSTLLARFHQQPASFFLLRGNRIVLAQALIFFPRKTHGGVTFSQLRGSDEALQKIGLDKFNGFLRFLKKVVGSI